MPPVPKAVTVPRGAPGEFLFDNPMAGKWIARRTYGKLPPLQRPTRAPVEVVEPVSLPSATAATAAAAEVALVPPVWQSAVNSVSGNTYYYRGTESTWDMPEELAQAQSPAATAAVTASKAAAAVATVAESANGSTKKKLKKEMENLGLPTEGTKKELVATVRAAVAPAAEQAAAATESALAGGGGSSSTSVNTTDEQKLAALNTLLGQYEIRPDFLQRTLQLDKFEIALILDNSSSMWSPSDAPMPPTFQVPAYASELRMGVSAGEMGDKINMGAPDLTNKRLFWTRWEELIHISKILIPIANVFDKSGVDLYFFGRDPIYNYRDATNFETIAGVADSPTGTPLTETLHQVLADKAEMPAGKNLLIFIITDGEPNGEQRHSNINF